VVSQLSGQGLKRPGDLSGWHLKKKGFRYDREDAAEGVDVKPYTTQGGRKSIRPSSSVPLRAMITRSNSRR